MTNAQLTLVRNPRGYLADKVNLSKITVHNGDTPTHTPPLVLAKKVYYATDGFPVATTKQFAAQGFRTIRPPTYTGCALYFNFGTHPEFRDKRVRQALAGAIDRDQNGQVSLGDSGKGTVLMTGISDLQVPQWVSDDAQGKLTKYKHDLSAAATLLTAAGWKKQSSTWTTSEGKPAEYTLIFPSSYTDWAASAQDLASQLNNFGIKVTLRGEDATQQPVDVGAGKFDLAIQAWGASNPFPSDPSTAALLTFNYPDQKPNRGMDFPLQQDTESAGKIDLETLVPDSGLGKLDTLKGKISTLVLVFNELLPIIPLVERYGDSPVLTSAVSGFPADDDPLYRNSMYSDNFVTVMMYQGVLKPA